MDAALSATAVALGGGAEGGGEVGLDEATLAELRAFFGLDTPEGAALLTRLAVTAWGQAGAPLPP